MVWNVSAATAAHSDRESFACLNLQRYSISFCGSSEVFSTSMNDDNVLMPALDSLVYLLVAGEACG